MANYFVEVTRRVTLTIASESAETARDTVASEDISIIDAAAEEQGQDWDVEVRAYPNSEEDIVCPSGMLE